MLTGNSVGKIRYRRLSTGETGFIQGTNHTNDIIGLVTMDRLIISASRDGIINMFDLNERRVSNRVINNNKLNCLNLNNNFLFCANINGSVTVYSQPDGKLIRVIAGPETPITGLSVHGNTVLVAHDASFFDFSNCIQFWDISRLSSGEIHSTTPWGQSTSRIESIDVLDDGRVVIGGANGTVNVVQPPRAENEMINQSERFWAVGQKIVKIQNLKRFIFILLNSRVEIYAIGNFHGNIRHIVVSTPSASESVNRELKVYNHGSPTSPAERQDNSGDDIHSWAR